MTDVLAKQQERRLYWWGVFVFFALLSINSLATSILGALVGTEWSSLNGQTKLLIVFSIVGNWSGLIIAFVKDVLARLAQGKPPIPTGDTSHWQRQPEK